MIYFTADTHFGDPAITGFGRPFENLEAMEKTIINNWNTVVTDDDIVYILGDFWFRGSKPVSHYVSQLSGLKALIPGNHDHRWIREQPESLQYFGEVSPYIELLDGRTVLNLFHYPILDWNGFRRKRYMIHGHTHASDYLNRYDKHFAILKELPRALNACVDINGYKPVTLEQLIENNNKFYRRK